MLAEHGALLVVDVQLERAVTAVFQTMEAEIPGGELNQVRQLLPAEPRKS
jgi:uncharacterized protein (DUF2267 family)